MVKILSLALLFFVNVLLASGSPRVRSADDLEEDITWALNNTTKLASDLNDLRDAEFRYFKHLSIDSAKDFQDIETLLGSAGVNPVEISRLSEMLSAMVSEVRHMIEPSLADVNVMQFQCVKIMSSLSLNLTQLPPDRATIEQMMTDLMLYLSTARLVVFQLFREVQSTILRLIEGLSGPEVDQILVLLTKIETDLGIQSAEVKAVATVASNTNNELGSVLDWIISQLP